MISLLSYQERSFPPYFLNRIMLSPKDHLGESILVREKTDSRVLWLCERVPLFMNENNYAHFQRISFC